MSYQDTVDFYKDLEEFEREERKQRAAGRQDEIAAMEKLGHNVQRFNNGNHVKISFLQYWPSTGAWHNPIKKRRGKLADNETLAELVRREVGKPIPLAHRRKTA